MAYNSANFYFLEQGIHRGMRRFAYFTADSLAVVLASGYFSDAFKQGMRIGDIVDVFVGTLNTALTSTPATAAAGAASDFTALSGYARMQCTVANTSTFACTVVTIPQGTAPTATSLFSLWGATASSQPTSSNEADISSSPSVSISATQWGFTSSAQATGIITLLRQLRADAIAVGWIKGS